VQFPGENICPFGFEPLIDASVEQCGMINAYTVAIVQASGSDDEAKAEAKDGGVKVIRLNTGEAKKLIEMQEHSRRLEILQRFGITVVSPIPQTKVNQNQADAPALPQHANEAKDAEDKVRGSCLILRGQTEGHNQGPDRCLT
jgi:hypothetical protein